MTTLYCRDGFTLEPFLGAAKHACETVVILLALAYQFDIIITLSGI